MCLMGRKSTAGALLAVRTTTGAVTTPERSETTQSPSEISSMKVTYG